MVSIGIAAGVIWHAMVAKNYLSVIRISFILHVRTPLHNAVGHALLFVILWSSVLFFREFCGNLSNLCRISVHITVGRFTRHCL